MSQLVSVGQLTITDLNDGLNIFLTSENMSLTADKNGVVASYVGCSTTVSVFLGPVDDSVNWSVTATPSAGVVGSFGTGGALRTYTISSLTVDNGYVDFIAAKAGTSNLTKRFTLTRNKQGIDGVRGPGQFYAVGSVWSDATANSTPPGGKIVGDTVTISNNSNFAQTKKWDGINWVSVGIVVDGSLITPSSLDITKFASSIEPVTLVTSVPGTKSTSTIFNSTDGKLYRWNGTSYISSIPATDLSTQITAGQLSANSVIAGKIDVGAISAREIQAAAITTDKLVVASRGQALNDDPAIEDLSAWFIGSNITKVSGTIVTGAAGSNFFSGGAGASDSRVTSRKMAIDPKKTYLLTANLFAAATNDRSMYIFVNMYDVAGAQVSTSWGGSLSGYVFGSITPPGVWTRQGGQFGAAVPTRTIPANVVSIQIGVWFQYSGSGTTNVQQGAQDIRLERANEGSLIVDGAITANKITVTNLQAINTDTGSLNVSGTIKSANGAFQVDSLGNMIATSATFGGVIVPSTTVGGTPISTVATNAATGATAVFSPKYVWEFRNNSEGWTPLGATVANGVDSITVTSTTTDPILASPTISVVGGMYDKVRARVRRVSGTGWDGQVFYTTAGHGTLQGYRKVIPDTTSSTFSILEWDMANLTQGGTDWTTSTIISIRLDLGATASDVFEVDWICIGKFGPTTITDLGFTGALNANVANIATKQGPTPVGKVSGDLWIDTGSINLQPYSENGAGWISSGTTPPVTTNVINFLGKLCAQTDFTPAMSTGYAACRTQRGSTPFPVTNGTAYSWSASISLSRALTGTESLVMYCTGSCGLLQITLNASNCAPYVGAFSRVIGANCLASVTGNDYFVTYLNGTLTSNLSMYTTELQVEAATVIGNYIPTQATPVSTVGINKLYMWDGTNWVMSDDSRISAATLALNNISNDNVLSKNEKSTVILDWTAINNEKAGLDAQADAQAISRVAYDTMWTTLQSYLVALSPAWNDTSTDTVIDGPTFRTNFANVYKEKQNLINAMAAKAATTATWTTVSGTGKPADNANVANLSFKQSVIPTASLIGDLWIDTGTTNLAQYSETLLSGVYSCEYSSKIVATPPAGISSAIKLVESVTNNNHDIYQGITGASTATPYTASWIVKAGERTALQLTLASSGFANGGSANFDLTAGTVSAIINRGTGIGTTAGIINHGGGWYRCWITSTPNFVGTLYAGILMMSGGVSAYSGDGTSGLYLAALQFEQSMGVGSYVPTVGAASANNLGNNKMYMWDGSGWTSSDDSRIAAATSALVSISSDNVLSKSEKSTVILDWNNIFGEKTGLDNQADALVVSRVNYDTAYNSLNTYLTGLSPAWNDVTTDTPINGGSFRSNFTAYYTEKQNLLNAMSAKAATTANWTSGLVNRPTDAQLLNNQNSVITSPGGGTFVNVTPTMTGALKIKLPVSWTSTMMRFTVEIYEYQTGFMCTLELGGYNYSVSPGWVNVSARVIGGSNVEYPVYFGHDGANCAIWIGAATETWSYPQVRIRDVFLGYSNYTVAMWENGWAISFDATAAQNVTASVLDTLPGADWSKTARRPANVAALTGTEGIQNTAITINPNGTLGGAGAGAVTLPGMGQQSYRVVAVGGSSTTAPIGRGVYLNGSVSQTYQATRSYQVIVITRATGVVASSTIYDVYGNIANATTMANDLNALTSSSIVVVYTYDEPMSNRLAGGLAAAMYRCGASPAVFGSANFFSRGSYILVGIAGCGAGNGAEMYQGAIGNDPNAWCDMSFSILNGNIVGVSGTSTPQSLTDYGYTGAYNATANVVTSGLYSAIPVGSNGDFYYATDTNLVYQKISGAWVLTASSNIMGSGMISNRPIGNNGDTYFGTDTGLFYQKIAGAWTTTATSNSMTSGIISARPIGNNGDTFYATDFNIFYQKIAGTWTPTANNFNNTTQLTDGAGWSTTALWTGVGGVGKPADNATANVVGSGLLSARPTGANGDFYFGTDTNLMYQKIGGVWVNTATSNFTSSGLYSALPTGANGDFYFATDRLISYQKISGAWVAAANNFTNTSQLTDGANLGGTALWTGVGSRPANVAALTGTEPILNTAITVAGGVLTGIGTSGVAVDNSAVTAVTIGAVKTDLTNAPAGVLNSNVTAVAIGAVKTDGTNAPASILNTNVAISAAGVLTGGGGGTVTIGGLGYTGALNATANNMSSGTLAARPVGANGDTYFATDTALFYQKLAGSWIQTASSNILSSGTLAARPTGANGDNYFGTDTNTFYQKISGAWVATSTYGAPAGTLVGSTPATTVESNASTALANANTANTALTGKLNSNAASTLTGRIDVGVSGAVAAGTAAWTGTNTYSGTGVVMSPYGIAGLNAGAVTFSINGTTGAAVFGGTLNAATGTFAGSLSAATGTFSGNISAATGTFSGALASANGNFTVDTSGNATAKSLSIFDYNGQAVLVAGRSLTSQTPQAPNLVERISSWPAMSGGAFPYTDTTIPICFNGEFIIFPVNGSTRVANSRVLNLQANTDYIVSFSANSNAANSHVTMNMFSATYDGPHFIATLPNDSSTMDFSFNVRDSAAGISSAALRFYNTGEPGQVAISNIKVEKGSKKTGWCDTVITAGNSSTYIAPGAITDTTITLSPLTLSGTFGGGSTGNTNVQQSIALTASASGGVGPYTYSWSVVRDDGGNIPLSLNAVSGTSVSVKCTANMQDVSGQVTCIASDSNGRSVTRTGSINMNFGNV